MILSELLNITAVNTEIQISQATPDRINPIVCCFNSINRYGKVDTRNLDKCIEEYGNMKVISQVINDNVLEILVK